MTVKQNKKKSSLQEKRTIKYFNFHMHKVDVICLSNSFECQDACYILLSSSVGIQTLTQKILNTY